jgi:hypothetical protein
MMAALPNPVLNPESAMSRLCSPAAAGGLAVLIVLAAVHPAVAQVAVVSVKSVDAGLSNFKYLADLVGQGAQAKLVDAYLKSKGAQGLEGVDRKRPCGAYATWPKKWDDLKTGDVPLVVLLPVADEQQVLGLLRKLEAKPHKEPDGLYRLTEPTGAEAFLRFAHHYAYLAEEAAWLRGKLPEPQSIVPAGVIKHTMAATLRFEGFEKEYRRLIDEGYETMWKDPDLARPKKRPGESDAAYAQRQLVFSTVRSRFDAFKRVAIGLTQQSRELACDLDVDPRRNGLSLDLALVPRPDTVEAALFQYAATARSRFTSLPHADRLSVRFHLPPAGGPKVTFTVKDFAGMRAGLRMVIDPKYIDLAVQGTRIAVATFLADGLDGSVDERSPPGGGEGTEVLIGWKVQDGDQLNKLLRDAIRGLPAEQQKEYAFAWNHARHAGARIHRCKLAFLDGDESYLAVRDDVVFLGSGKHGLQWVKEALDHFAKTPPPASPLLAAEANSGLFLENKSFAQALPKELSGAARERLRVRLRVEGGKDLRLHLEMNPQLLRWLNAVSGS